MVKTKYLTHDEKENRVYDEMTLFVEKLEKKYKLQINYNVEGVDFIWHMNNRKYKFRAWDGKQMDNDPECYAGDMGDSLNLVLDDSSRHLMQFTGLLDKHSKEIYEGDIVENLGEIVWDTEFALFTVGTEPLSDIALDTLEIIGNIYENGDLLKWDNRLPNISAEN